MPEHEKTETPLEMAQRHVSEGQERIAHLEQRLAELDRDGHDKMAREADELLQTLRQTQALAEDDLAQRQQAVKEGHLDGSLAGVSSAPMSTKL